MPLDFLFRKSTPGRALGRRNERREPFLEAPAPIEPPRRIESKLTRPVLPEPVVAGAPAPVSEIEVRAMSPRQMADWAHEMYMLGWIGWSDYRATIPPELLPGYDATIGALTGEFAAPDRPRDMVREWEERLAFAERHYDGDDRQLKLAERIVQLLRFQDMPREAA